MISRRCNGYFNHRYRRPSLLTEMFYITHARDNHKYSKWRLNRAKIIERYREKSCFLHFASSYTASDIILGRTNWCDGFGRIFVQFKFNKD
jgi:hypothetical protein